jgi:hypothetical protein
VVLGGARGADGVARRVGVAARRPGSVGLLAALVVLVGAGAQMVLTPPDPQEYVTPSVFAARALVWAFAAILAAWAVRRWWSARTPARAYGPSAPQPGVRP